MSKLAECGMLRVGRLCLFLDGLLGAVFGFSVVAVAAGDAWCSVPVIHCTDLFHPHDDPDDHFDLATLYAMPELDIKGVVLDQGRVGFSGRIEELVDDPALARHHLGVAGAHR